jgi:hypothetical protein
MRGTWPDETGYSELFDLTKALELSSMGAYIRSKNDGWSQKAYVSINLDRRVWTGTDTRVIDTRLVECY